MSVIENYPAIRPGLLLDFANSGRVDPRVQCTRASTATCFGSDGKLRTVANNVPRVDYDPVTGKCLGLLVEEARTNAIRNNTMVGAVAGAPGTLPTNWSASTPINALSREVVGVGVEDGIDYIDIRWQGTASAGSAGMGVAAFEPNTGIAATSAQTWSFSACVRHVGGSMAGINSVALRFTMRDAAGASLGSVNSSNLPVTNSALASQRYSMAITPTDVATAFLSPFVSIGYSAGAVIDITLRIGLPQMELGTFPTSIIRTTNAAATRAADAISMAYSAGAAGALFCDSVVAGASATGFVVRLHELSTSYVGVHTVTASAPQRTGYVRAAEDGGAAIATAPGAALQFGALTRSGIGWGSGRFAVAINGEVSADTAIQSKLPLTTSLSMCRASTGGSTTVTATIRRIALYEALLTSNQLKRLTA